MKKGSTLWLSALAVGLLLVGCGQKAGPVANPSDQQAFDKAPAGVKQVWEQALEADRTNGFVLAQRLLYGLSQQPLPPDQMAAVKNTTAAINKRLNDAAEKGDAAAVEALRELRRHPVNR
jgi:hypothetical protein